LLCILTARHVDAHAYRCAAGFGYTPIFLQSRLPAIVAAASNRQHSFLVVSIDLLLAPNSPVPTRRGARAASSTNHRIASTSWSRRRNK